MKQERSIWAGFSDSLKVIFVLIASLAFGAAVIFGISYIIVKFAKFLWYV